MAKAVLGKGLGALISPKVGTPTPISELGERVQQIALADIVPTPLQPRKGFHSESLRELIESIRERGIIQPLIVRQLDDKFELIAGERRWRAAKEVGLKEAPVIVREATDQEVLELALVENLQREDLNPIEEAEAFTRLSKEFHLKQEEIARKVGKSRAAVANSMRLLDLQSQVRGWVAQRRISVGHAKLLLSIKAPDEQLFLAEQIIRRNSTVRQAEKLIAAHVARQQGSAKQSKSGKAPELSPDLQHLQNRLREHFATNVTIQHGEKKGKIDVEYYGNDDLHRIIDLFGLEDENV